MHNLKVVIIGKEKIAYEGEAESLFVPTQTGIIEILPTHMQLVSALSAGEIIIKKASPVELQPREGKETKFKVSGGVLEVRTKSNVIILADII